MNSPNGATMEGLTDRLWPGVKRRLGDQEKRVPLALAELEQAVESAIKAAYPSRQKKKSFARELATGKKAFRRRLRSILKRHL